MDSSHYGRPARRLATKCFFRSHSLIRPGINHPLQLQELLAIVNLLAGFSYAPGCITRASTFANHRRADLAWYCDFVFAYLLVIVFAQALNVSAVRRNLLDAAGQR